ncbi:MAG: substrate-binding domain-containing protein, partial [Desulfobacterales bacterium]|nr:substrate-binding domain-containing protein [Desulfobacterales bacterium]
SLRMVNRRLGTGTRQLLDRELQSAGVNAGQIQGYQDEVQRHMDVGLAVLAGKADVGPGIQPVAEVLGLDFVPWRWERYDLLIHKERFFDQTIQLFLGLLHEEPFLKLAAGFEGYDTAISGKMIFAHQRAKTDNHSTIESKESKEAQ